MKREIKDISLIYPGISESFLKKILLIIQTGNLIGVSRLWKTGHIKCLDLMFPHQIILVTFFMKVDRITERMLTASFTLFTCRLPSARKRIKLPLSHGTIGFCSH